MGWEVLPHTADMGLRVWANDLDALFAESATAIVALMGTAPTGVVRRERVDLTAPDLDALFVDFLSEVLFLFEARSVVPQDVSVRVTRDPWRVSGEIAGYDADTIEQQGPQVKAVTYHGLRIGPTDDGFEAVVYLDV